MMKLKCSIIKVSLNDPEIHGTLLSISNGQGAVRVGDTIREYPLSRIWLDSLIEDIIDIDEVPEVEEEIEAIPPGPENKLTSKLKGTK